MANRSSQAMWERCSGAGRLVAIRLVGSAAGQNIVWGTSATKVSVPGTVSGEAQ